MIIFEIMKFFFFLIDYVLLGKYKSLYSELHDQKFYAMVIKRQAKWT